MLFKTRGIVLKTTDYSESSVVVQVFTEKFGLQSYLINGVKKPRAKIGINMLQPLHLLDMVVYHKQSSGIQRLSELRNRPVFSSIPYHIGKSSVAIFLNEVLYRALRSHDADERMFEFMFHSLEILDQMETGLSNFHLYFLLRLTRFLGFYPDTQSEADGQWFDLQTGSYARSAPAHPLVVNPENTQFWHRLLQSSYAALPGLYINPANRKQILDSIIQYYQIHIEGFGTIRSHEVLEEVLS